MNSGRMMVFIDGENIAMRFQSMKEKGEKTKSHYPKPSVCHKKDVYAWETNSVLPGPHEIIRASYYTYSLSADEGQLSEIKNEIKRLSFQKYHNSALPCNLYPVVFRKQKGKKAKGVDIQMTVDILSHVYQNNLDTVYLISGDGDYKPIIEEAMRYGKRVILAAFSDGLNPLLKHLSDEFVDLDPIYFEDATTAHKRTLLKSTGYSAQTSYLIVVRTVCGLTIRCSRRHRRRWLSEFEWLRRRCRG